MKRSELKEIIREEIRSLQEYDVSYDPKDKKRIDDLIKKAKDDAHAVRLAKTMASRIKDKKKALRRAYAAEDWNYHDIAKVFYDRAEEL